jgi:hypothetical protein
MDLFRQFHLSLLYFSIFVSGCAPNTKSVGTGTSGGGDSHAPKVAVKSLKREGYDTLSSNEISISGVPLSKLRPENIISIIPDATKKNSTLDGASEDYQVLSLIFDNRKSWIDFEGTSPLRAIRSVIVSDKLVFMKQNFKVGDSITELSKAGYKLEPIEDYDNSFEANIWFKDPELGAGYIYFESLENQLLINRIILKYLIDEGDE